MLQVLIVEDDANLRAGLVMLLEAEGYGCLPFSSVEQAEQALQPGAGSAQVADLCVLDRNLPGCSGDKLCQRLRHAHPLLPILMLSARVESRDRVAGLRAGADDYLCKPFCSDELVARLASMRRRLAHTGSGGEGQLRCHGVSLDAGHMSLSGPDDLAVSLSPREYRLLRLLFLCRGKAADRHDLYNAGWGHQHLPNSRALDQMIVGLRAKLRRVACSALRISSVRGVGYRLSKAEHKV